MTTNEVLCPDWVVLNLSNVHVAKHKTWFKTYTPWTSALGSFYSDSIPNMPVLGIGTIELKAKPSPTSDTTEIITLTDVLHVPTYICNAIGQPIVRDYNIVFAKEETVGGIFTRSGKQLACLKPEHTLFAVNVLPPRDHTFGESAFKPNMPYMISCQWSKAEVRKWQEHKKKEAGQFDASGLYTPEERKFLKDKYGGQYKFLRQHGLSIQKDEDREQGRAILRSVMHAAKGTGIVKLGVS